MECLVHPIVGPLDQRDDIVRVNHEAAKEDVLEMAEFIGDAFPRLVGSIPSTQSTTTNFPPVVEKFPIVLVKGRSHDL